MSVVAERKIENGAWGGAVETPVPFNTRAEECVIASLIIDRDAIIKIAPYLRPEDFHTERYGLVYRAIAAMYERRVPADHVTVVNELTNMGMLEQVRWSEIVGMIVRIPTAAHIRYYAQIVVDCAMRRALIACGGNIAALGYDRGLQVQDLMDRAQSILQTAYERTGPEEYATFEQAMNGFYDRLDDLQSANEWQAGIPTGFDGLRRYLKAGLRRGHLIIIAARTSVGKTALALNIAANAAKRGHMVGIFSLEMSEQDLMERFVSAEALVDSTHLQHGGDLTDQERERVVDTQGRIASWPILIDDRAGVRINELALRARRMQAEHGLDLLVVDYLQLVKGTPRNDGNRALELGEVANGLKVLARQMNVSVLACCQLNRDLENRADKRPQLSDIRDSGEIEQAADTVVMLYREEMYDRATTRQGITDLLVRKQRGGPTGDVPMRFDNRTTRFYDIAYDWE